MKRLSVIFTLCFLWPAVTVTTVLPAERVTGFDPTPFLGTRWYGVYLMGEKVGYGFFRLAGSTHQGKKTYTTGFSVSYRLNLGGKTQEMSLEEEKIFLPGEGLTAFTVTNDSILGRTSFTGRKKDGLFEVTTPTGTQTIPDPREDLEGALADLVLVFSKSPPGTSIETTQLEPTLLKPVRIIHTVDSIEERFINGVPLKIYRINSTFPELGVSSLSLIDENLHVLEAKVSVLTIREEGEEQAKDLGYTSDLLLATSVKPDRPLPDPRRIRSLTLRLRGIKDPDLIIPSPRQGVEKLGPETYRLKITLQEDRPGPDRQVPVLGPTLKPFLQPTAYIQSTHPSIRQLARKIAGDDKNASRVAGKLVDWLYTNLGKSFLAAIPNAVGVLKKQTGDCKAHSILFVALARSLGLPARPVAGLVATEDGSFYYHQWAEAYTGEWISVDPVFGQVPADATHIKLSQGDLSKQLRLLNVIGGISIDILDYETVEE